MLVVRYTSQPCPHCGAQLDSSAGFEEDVEPHHGDVSVCAACCGFLLWEERQDNGELWQVRLKPREFNALPGSVRADLMRARARLERFHAEAKAGERKAH